MDWAVATYDTTFGYVSAHGAPLLDLLDPKPDERIIDLGCGTGVMTVEIAEQDKEATRLLVRSKDGAFIADAVGAAVRDANLATSDMFSVVGTLDDVFRSVTIGKAG